MEPQQNLRDDKFPAFSHNAEQAKTACISPRVAVLIPCYNEILTIAAVVRDFLKALPHAEIYVYDNNSTDGCIEALQQLLRGVVADSSDADFDWVAASPRVHFGSELRQGKGNVVRTMFREVDADVYLMVDADCTYDAADAPRLVASVAEQGYDMVIGDRLSSSYFAENKRRFHGVGNKLVRQLINSLFNRRRGERVQDIMTGYRAFSRDFVKTCPVLSKGFEIETEITVHALFNNFKITSLTIAYHDRPQGSVSKLNTYQDGMRVLLLIFNLFRSCRPLLFFSMVSALCMLPAIGFLIPVLFEYASTGIVYKLPSFVASCVFLMLAVWSFFTGLILDTMNQNQRKLYELSANLINLQDVNYRPPTRFALRGGGILRQ